MKIKDYFAWINWPPNWFKAGDVLDVSDTYPPSILYVLLHILLDIQIWWPPVRVSASHLHWLLIWTAQLGFLLWTISLDVQGSLSF